MNNVLRGLMAAGCALFGASLPVFGQEVTLTLSHFLSPKAQPHAQFLEPWARTIEEESDGRIAIEVFPSMSLGGKPPELYRQLRDGAADIVWTVTGYTPGVFPRSEVFELPTVHRNSARSTTLAIQENFDLIAEDFDGIKPLLVHVHAGQAVHLVDGCIDGLDGFEGLKLRTPSRTGAWMIEAWGAEPVGMPAPALPQALSAGTIDGALIPYEIVPPLKVHELTECSLTGADDLRFGTAVFLFAMNQDSYDALPDDLKAVIDRHSGLAIAERTGELWDRMEQPGRALQTTSGSSVEMLDATTTETLLAAGEKVVQRWIDEAASNGIDAEALVASARKAIAAQSD